MAFVSSFWTSITIVSMVVSMGATRECDSFDHVRSEVIEINGRQSVEVLDGCIERKKLHDKTIAAAYFRNQNIPKLGKGSVRYLVKMDSISFYGCNVEEIEAGAFKAVPRLKNLQISFGKLKRISSGVFNPIEALQLLRLHDNAIASVEDDAFANLTVLKKIFAGNNQLAEWRPAWFHNSTELHTVDFSGNRVGSLPEKAFAGLPKLRQISFDSNEIASVGRAAFEGLAKLEYLGLRNNKLSALDHNAFPTPIRIERFLINANYLNYLPGELLDKMAVGTAVIDYNPWSCPCLAAIHGWLLRTGGALGRSGGCESTRAPVCVAREGRTCSEKEDNEARRRFFGVFKNFSESLAEGCVRVDYQL